MKEIRIAIRNKQFELLVLFSGSFIRRENITGEKKKRKKVINDLRSGDNDN